MQKYGKPIIALQQQPVYGPGPRPGPGGAVALHRKVFVTL